MKTNSLYEPLLLEVAWEVCNKVGGIYTVIQSKVPYMMERWGDQYCTIGPLTSEELPIEFQPASDYSDAYGKAVLKMREAGFKVEYGFWLIEGKPRVILLDIFQVYGILDNIKADFLKHHHVAIPNDELLNKVTAFGYLVTRFIETIAKPEITDKQIITHIHEWMSGIPLPEIKRLNIPVATIFTTHATMLGRYVAMNEPGFYIKLPSFNWLKEARRFGIEAQVGIERLATHSADIMSTVSKVTDNECEYLLGRRSDIILPNGLNIKKFTAMHEFQNLHQEYKYKINDFITGHFFNNYSFDLKNTLYFFTSGRYEFVNKGYDITLEALYRLNDRMRKAKIDRTVVMFFVTKKPFYSINPLVLQLRSMVDEIKETTTAIQEQIGEKLFKFSTKEGDGVLPDLNEFVDDYWMFRYKKTLQKWKSKYLPLIVTHNLKNDQDDDILHYLRDKEFYNQEENPVKIVYHPDFIDSTNPLFKIDYQQFVRGCNLGIFPSYYEPWGYTPVECVARGVPTVTSDLAGFGDYAKASVPDLNEKGVYVLRRRNHNFDEIVEQLTDYMFQFVQQSNRERIAQRNRVESLSDNFSWKSLGRHYMEAYRMAIEKLNG